MCREEEDYNSRGRKMRVKVSRKQIELQGQIDGLRELRASDNLRIMTLQAELKKEDADLHRQRYESLTRLIDSVATLNRSLASVVEEAGALITKG